jgi:hypothetical protein
MTTRSRIPPNAVPWACAAVGAAALCSLAFRAATSVVGHPLTEDGFYSLTVARSIAAGDGFVVDGRATNGFQPLFTVLCAPLFLPFPDDPVTPLRLVLLVHVLFVCATALVLGAIARDAFIDLDRLSGGAAAATTTALFVCANFVLLQELNGLETSCVTCGYVVVWRVCQRYSFEARRRRLFLGLLLGLLVLARIDSVFFAGAVVVAVAWSGASTRDRLSRFAEVGGVAFVVAAPWFAYGLVRFGSLMPSSGYASQEWQLSPYRLEAGAQALLRAAVPWLETGTHQGELATVVRAIVAAAVVGSLARSRRQLDASWRTGALLAGSVAILFAWYTSSSRVPGFYARYFAPLVPVSVLAGSWALLDASRGRAWFRSTATIGAASVVVVTVALLHAGVGFAGNTLLADQVSLVREYVPPGDVVGAAQTGTLGYFREHVLNLDGKVNAEALAHRGDMPAYLASRDVRWFCDWVDNVPSYLGPSPAASGWVLVARRGRSVLFHRP